MRTNRALTTIVGVTTMLISHQAGALPLATYANDPPISFTYGGRPSAELFKTWKPARESVKIDKSRTRHTVSYTDPLTGLQVRLVSVAYHDFPTIEWTAYFKNTGTADTPILADIKAIDTKFDRGDKGEFILHHQKGTFVQADDFEPLTTTLGPNAKAEFVPPGGRSTGAVWPYYNLQWGDGGAIVVIAWPGQWSATFERDDVTGLSIRAGQQFTHMKLHPGEEVRTPLIVIQSYKGDWIDAQNVWRKWMIAYDLPRQNGKLPPPQMNACSSHQFAEMINANEENQKFFVDRYAEEKLGLNYWWMDAGWYICDGSWPKTGTWEVDKARFPNGLKPICDDAHSKGMKIIVWFEPERVAPGTWLYEKHPEWMLLTKPGEQALLNLGSKDALDWLINHVDGIITSEGIDLYRQDYNVAPLPHWQAADTEDRQGYTENAYVQGYLAYWDALRRRHPNMLIDSCASGGHRNDLETMRRAVPLLRSDYIFEPIGQQGHTYGLAFWLPFFGTGIKETRAYDVRSTMCSSFTACWDMRDRNLDYASLRKLCGQWRDYSENFYGDYYPLTPYSLDKAAWIAWQFDRPKEGKGMVQAFRRDENPDESITLKLRGLDAKANYSVRDIDTEETGTYSGKELMDKGLVVKSVTRPEAKVVEYTKTK